MKRVSGSQDKLSNDINLWLGSGLWLGICLVSGSQEWRFGGTPGREMSYTQRLNLAGEVVGRSISRNSVGLMAYLCWRQQRVVPQYRMFCHRWWYFTVSTYCARTGKSVARMWTWMLIALYLYSDHAEEIFLLAGETRLLGLQGGQKTGPF